MAYKLEPFSFRLGGVNLISPGDQIPDQDALVATNWRIDRYSQLLSRKGNADSELSSAAALIHTARFVAGRRYWGYGTTLRRNGSSIATGLSSSTPWGIAAYGNNVFIASSASGTMIRDTGSTTLPWLPAKPTNTPSAVTSGAGPIEGAYQWLFTYSTVRTGDADPRNFTPTPGDVDFETNPSVLSNEVICSGDQVDISNVFCPATTTGVYSIKLYRVGDGLPEPTLVGIWDIDANGFARGGTATLTDSYSDEAVADDPGTLLETDHDPPPLADGCVSHMGRMVIFRSPANPKRVYYSPAFKPAYFPGAANGSAGFWFDVDDDIVDVVTKPRALHIYTKTSIWRVAGDMAQNPPERTRSDFGAVAPLGQASLGLVDYFRARDGICEFNGETASLITSPVGPLFTADTVNIALGDSLQQVPFARASLATTVLCARSTRLWVLGTDTDGNRQTWLFDPAINKWVRDSRHLYNLMNEGDGGDLIGCFAATEAGVAHVGAYILESGTTDGSAVGGQYVAVWHSRYSDQGAPANDKVYEDVFLEVDTDGRDMTVTAYTNNGEAAGDEYLVGTVNTTERTQVVMAINTGGTRPGIRGKNLALRLAVTNTGQTIAVYKAGVHFYVEPRQAKSFDTGETDGRIPWVKQLLYVQLDLENAGNVTVKLYSDQPGSAMAQRDTWTVATGTRRQINLPIDADTEGRLLRITLVSSSDFQMFDQVRVLVRAVPEYYNGAASEGFTSNVLRIAG